MKIKAPSRLPKARAQAHVALNNLVAAKLAKAQTLAPIYAAKLEQAHAVLAGDTGPMIDFEAGLHGMSSENLAEMVVKAAEKGKADTIAAEAFRLQQKRAIDNAATLVAVEDLIKGYHQQAQALFKG